MSKEENGIQVFGQAVPAVYIDDIWRPKFHLSPDIVREDCRYGMCLFDGEYHILFFNIYGLPQDSSFAEHFSTKDFINYTRYRSDSVYLDRYAEIIGEASYLSERRGFLDLGYDFYSPCIIRDDNGRCITAALMPGSVSDYGEFIADCALAFPRTLTYSGENIFSAPVAEIEKLRQNHERIFIDKYGEIQGYITFDAEIKVSEGIACAIDIFGCVELWYCGGTFYVSHSGAGKARPRKKAVTGKLENIRILCDTSSVEVFVNNGEAVFTSRFYPRSADGVIKFFNITAWVDIWKMGGINIKNDD